MRFLDTPRSAAAPILALLTLAGCAAPMAPALQYPDGYPPGQLPPQGQPGQPGQPGPQGYAPQPGYAPAPGQFSPQGPPAPQGYAPGQLPPQGPQPPQAYAPPPGQLPPQGYGPPPGQPAPQAYPPAYPQAPAPPPAPPPAFPQIPGLLSGLLGAADPINTVDLGYLRGTGRAVLGELVAALPPTAQAKVQGVPFDSDTKVGEINAYASCDEAHQPHMAITDGLLQVEAYMAQLRATDEIFGTQKLDQYLQVLARDQKAGQPIVTPPAGLVDPAQHVDPRKVARQHQLLEEQLAFVLGHELGHHWLGHTGCANGQSGERQVTLGDLGRLGNKVVPVTNQPIENDADGVGVDDLLAAGARRPGYHWTEQGAVLTLSFFSRLQSLHDAGLMAPVVSLLSSHPDPAARLPLVQAEARRFKSAGTWYQPTALVLPPVALPLPFPIP